MATVKCKRCGAYYDSDSMHRCSVGDDLQKGYFGEQETAKEGTGRP